MIELSEEVRSAALKAYWQAGPDPESELDAILATIAPHVVPLAPLRVWIERHKAEGFCDQDHAIALEGYIEALQFGTEYDWEA